MTIAVTGKAGVVNLTVGVQLEITGWNLDRNFEIVEITSMDSSGNREYISGLFQWSGSFTALVFANELSGDPVGGTFQVGATTTAALPKFTGNVILSNEPIACPVDGRVEYQYTFQGTGALTAATA